MVCKQCINKLGEMNNSLIICPFYRMAFLIAFLIKQQKDEKIIKTIKVESNELIKPIVMKLI